MRNGQLTFGFRSSPRPVSLTIAEISHVYALLSLQPVANCFPSVGNDTQSTASACWRGEPMGRPFSRFHNRAVLSRDALAKIRSLGETATALMEWVCSVKTAICCQVIVFHVLIDSSCEPEISIFPSAVQARQFTSAMCPSYLQQGFIARISCVTAVGRDIVSPGIATTTTLSQLPPATIYAITHPEMCLLGFDVCD
jgi:hypothetical protein